jgi:hypothetical protein
MRTPRLLFLLTASMSILHREMIAQSETTNSCFETSQEPGCSDPVCQESVCEFEGDCCTDRWGGTCVQTAIYEKLRSCPNDWPTQHNSCFEKDAFGRSNCTGDPECQAIVCRERPRCCEQSYDDGCVEFAINACELPHHPDNTCYETSYSLPGCMDATCSKAVCTLNPSCCVHGYTSVCVEIARQNGDQCVPPIEAATNVCTLDESPIGGCQDAECEAAVCEIRPNCCNRNGLIGEWSAACIQIAEETCHR